MTTRNTIGFIGILLMLACGPALAHDRPAYTAYPDGGWSGAVTVWGDSVGHSRASGALTYSYGVGYGYAPGYIPWAAAHQHGPRCGHAPGHALAKAYRKGYRDGRRHSHGHDHGHGYRH